MQHHATGAKTQGLSNLWAGALFLVNQLLQQAGEELLATSYAFLPRASCKACGLNPSYETYLLDL